MSSIADAFRSSMSSIINLETGGLIGALTPYASVAMYILLYGLDILSHDKVMDLKHINIYELYENANIYTPDVRDRCSLNGHYRSRALLSSVLASVFVVIYSYKSIDILKALFVAIASVSIMHVANISDTWVRILLSLLCLPVQFIFEPFSPPVIFFSGLVHIFILTVHPFLFNQYFNMLISLVLSWALDIKDFSIAQMALTMEMHMVLLTIVGISEEKYLAAPAHPSALDKIFRFDILRLLSVFTQRPPPLRSIGKDVWKAFKNRKFLAIMGRKLCFLWTLSYFPPFSLFVVFASSAAIASYSIGYLPEPFVFFLVPICAVILFRTKGGSRDLFFYDFNKEDYRPPDAELVDADKCAGSQTSTGDSSLLTGESTPSIIDTSEDPVPSSLHDPTLDLGLFSAISTNSTDDASLDASNTILPDALGGSESKVVVDSSSTKLIFRKFSDLLVLVPFVFGLLV